MSEHQTMLSSECQRQIKIQLNYSVCSTRFMITTHRQTNGKRKFKSVFKAYLYNASVVRISCIKGSMHVLLLCVHISFHIKHQPLHQSAYMALNIWHFILLFLLPLVSKVKHLFAYFTRNWYQKCDLAPNLNAIIHRPNPFILHLALSIVCFHVKLWQKEKQRLEWVVFNQEVFDNQTWKYLAMSTLFKESSSYFWLWFIETERL